MRGLIDNSNLSRAKSAKNDEFYTRIEDIEEELKHYKKHFRDKIVYCNCNYPRKSKFWEYFHINFKELGLKKLISTYYNENGKSFKFEYIGGNDNDIKQGIKTNLKGNGDFRSSECIEILKEADIVVTNGPLTRTNVLQ